MGENRRAWGKRGNGEKSRMGAKKRGSWGLQDGLHTKSHTYPCTLELAGVKHAEEFRQ